MVIEKKQLRAWLIAMGVLGLFAVAFETLALPPHAQRPASTSGTVVVPDRFVRRWDPITVFFDKDLGPARGGPEDQPSKYVKMSPTHPGAFMWLDARTLQFKPSDPWPPLIRVHLTTDGNTAKIATLMPAPMASQPARDASGLLPVEEIRFTFPEPIPIDAMSRMLSIELRDLPGIGASGGRFLARDDFKLKAVQRNGRSDPAAYIVALAHPIPFGTRAVVHFRLSLDEDAGEALSEISFSTAPPFRAVRLRCDGSVEVPLSPAGVSYGKEQALKCKAGRAQIFVDFSAPPKALGPVQAKNLVQIVPPVEDLGFEVQGSSLAINARFVPETVYKIALAPVPLRDERDRLLDMTGASSAFLYFPKQAPYLKVARGRVVMERFGPQTLPLEGRGQDRLDLRVFKIDPLDRNMWPFPEKPITIDESQRPPGPGEEPARHSDPASISPSEIALHISALGSPQGSTIITTPLKRDGSGGGFGLDIEPQLAKVGGKDKPGTYIVGVRRLDGSHERSWTRVQVTDLVLSTAEEPDQVRFAVTSLSSGLPVSGAEIRVEGGRLSSWVTIMSGTTGRDGQLVWKAPGDLNSANVQRLSIKKDDDVLVLDAAKAPDGYKDNQWFASRDTWLSWTQSELTPRLPKPEPLCHMFPERPVYKPDEEVHLKGYLRDRFAGKLQALGGVRNGEVVVDGPGDLSWRYPVALTQAGSFYYKFEEKGLPTGAFNAHFEDKDGHKYCHTTFKIEAFRLPEFELVLNGPDRAPLDREFKVGLSASYYAGGRASGLPVRWRVTQFPHTWQPAKRPGFAFSSDSRFTKAPPTSSQKIEKEDVTNAEGAASITINPTLEASAAPRQYVVEATVTGADDQTVTATESVVALPPFALGLSVPRTVEKKKSVDASLIVLDSKEKPIVGQKVTVRLLNRQWHSYLAAGDFSEGAAKYVTDIVDEKVSETVVTSTEAPLVVPLALPRSGVFLVEVESRDRLGRAQVLTVDFFSAGDEPVSWQKPPSEVFSVATDKAKYDPGETASIVLKSPFQNAQALAVVEGPEGNQYSWIEVKGGSAVFRVPIKGEHTPRVPVHFLLMRGRVKDSAPLPATLTDLGKPQTLAATAWLGVNPVDNMIDVGVLYPEKAQPGTKVQVTVKLKTPKDGKPLAGEVTLWLVDQAVLALGAEQPLDPVPDFITQVRSRLVMKDTRNDIVGFMPFSPNAGGDGDEAEDGPDSLLDNVTVRKNFKIIAYYNPTLAIPSSGSATVTVQLPDNLTNFKIRAKAVSGNNRFGVGTGMISVRLPLIVQPALPRFARPGDAFMAAGIGRVVEGPGGAGASEVRIEGAKAKGPLTQRIDWVPNTPVRIEVPVEIVSPPYDANGKLAQKEVTFTMGVSRKEDGVRDAFKVSIPLRDDRTPVNVRTLVDLQEGKAVDLAALPEEARPGTVRREVLVSTEPAIVKMAAGLDTLMAFPHHCTEQRVSQARAQLALKKFRALLSQRGGDSTFDRAVKGTLEHLKSVVDPNGLVAYWPGARGYVSLTAWSLLFIVEAEEAGYAADPALKTQLMTTLRQALRSDYTKFISGEAWEERSWSLLALSAAGDKQPAYIDELGRDARYLDLEGSAEVLMAYSRSGQGTTPVAAGLGTKLASGVVFRLFQGSEMYGGLQSQASSRNGLILPSETRTLGELTRALYRTQSKHPRLPLLVNALVTLGRDDGWGSTNASASALLALAEVLSSVNRVGGERSVVVSAQGKQSTLELKGGAPVQQLVSVDGGAVTVTMQKGGSGQAVLRSELSYIPAADGSKVASGSRGFVVTREWQVIAAKGPAAVTLVKDPGATLVLAVADVVEDHVQIVNPKDRNHVAVVVPLAAGVEPLNPALATAPPEATPRGQNSLVPTYVAFLDDQVTYYYDSLPKGTFDFYFRTRASVAGRFIQPPARAEMMYDMTVSGNSAGGIVQVTKP